MKSKVRIIDNNRGDYHIIWEDPIFSPGDEVVDIRLLKSGKGEATRICESTEDADLFTNSPDFGKLVCGPEKIGYFIFPGTIHHDRVVMYLDDYTIEELHPDTIPEILESGGECEIQIHNLSPEGGGSPIPFLVDNKVLIHWKK